MYKKLTLTVLLGGLVIGAMAQHDGAKKRQPLLTAMKAKDIKVADGLMTPEVLWAMGRIGSYDVSEKAGLIVEDVTYYSVERNKSQHVIKTMKLDGSDVKQLTKSAMSESDPVFIQNGTRIAFLSVGTNRKLQVWSMNTDGSNKQQMSNEPDDVEGFIFSPDETKIILIKEVKYGKSTTDIYPDLEKASGMVIDDLMYRHWDETVTSIPHPFIAEVTDGKIHDASDILQDEQFECPMKPFGGIEQLAWSPDSRKIAYTCRKKTGLAYSISTDSDIYLYDTAKGQITNLCKPADYKEPEIDPTISMKEQKVNAQGDLNMGYDTNPQFSADGKYVAWLSMARNGYESDRNRLCVYEIATGKKSYVTEKFESGVDNFAWLPGNKSLCFTGVWHGCTMLYTTDLKGNVKKITDGQFDLN
ncbi:MAG: PD40 domain-containing protein, partial [Bacteroidaceae bacterium]|nr:PD40 domain-containing protein [Bacteroidaceae bacterium]